jgi:hypothetical protein
MTDVATEIAPASEANVPAPVPAPVALDTGIPRATLGDLQSKKRARREVMVEIPSEDGPKKVSFLFVAISRKEYDQLIDAHPPTKAQIAKGDQYNLDTFAPTLLWTRSPGPGSGSPRSGPRAS